MMQICTKPVLERMMLLQRTNMSLVNQALIETQRQALWPVQLRALLEYGFSSLNISRLIAIVRLANRASQRMGEKAGMHFWQMILIDTGLCHIYDKGIIIQS
jgi:hypothetical protein